MRDDFFVWPGEKELARKHFRSAQNGGCAICGTSYDLCVDHEHSPIALCRGMLCQACNRGLGAFKDNPESLARAIVYLSEHERRNDDYRESGLWMERVPSLRLVEEAA